MYDVCMYGRLKTRSYQEMTYVESNVMRPMTSRDINLTPIRLGPNISKTAEGTIERQSLNTR